MLEQKSLVVYIKKVVGNQMIKSSLNLSMKVDFILNTISPLGAFQVQPFTTFVSRMGQPSLLTFCTFRDKLNYSNPLQSSFIHHLIFGSYRQSVTWKFTELWSWNRISFKCTRSCLWFPLKENSFLLWEIIEIGTYWQNACELH